MNVAEGKLEETLLMGAKSRYRVGKRHAEAMMVSAKTNKNLLLKPLMAAREEHRIYKRKAISSQ